MQFDLAITLIAQRCEAGKDTLVVLVVRIEPTISKSISIGVFVRLPDRNKRLGPSTMQFKPDITFTRFIMINHDKN